MKVKAIAPWFGGKRTLAPDIVRQLGEHTQYFEPFCGSMSVLFAKSQSQKETVNDLHGDLINLARCLQDEQLAIRIYERCQSALFCESLLQDALDVLETNELDPDKLDADRAFWFFLASWMGRNGTAGTKRVDYQIAVRWTKNGGSPTVRWKNATGSIPAWHRRLSNVVILRRDAFTILDRFEDCSATAIYIDPPYVIDKKTRSGSGKYLHDFTGGDMFDADPHERLRDVLEQYQQARVVVSYYDCENVRELDKDWTFIDKERHKHLHAQNGRGARPKKAPEVLIVNGYIFATNDRKY